MAGKPKRIEHGTIGGYRTHLRRGERACAECRAEWSRYVQERRAKTGRR